MIAAGVLAAALAVFVAASMAVETHNERSRDIQFNAWTDRAARVAHPENARLVTTLQGVMPKAFNGSTVQVETIPHAFGVSIGPWFAAGVPVQAVQALVSHLSHSGWVVDWTHRSEQSWNVRVTRPDGSVVVTLSVAGAQRGTKVTAFTFPNVPSCC